MIHRTHKVTIPRTPRVLLFGATLLLFALIFQVRPANATQTTGQIENLTPSNIPNKAQSSTTEATASWSYGLDPSQKIRIGNIMLFTEQVDFVKAKQEGTEHTQDALKKEKSKPEIEKQNTYKSTEPNKATNTTEALLHRTSEPVSDNSMKLFLLTEPEKLKDTDPAELKEQGKLLSIDQGQEIFLYPIKHEGKTLAVVVTNQCSTGSRFFCTYPAVSVFLLTEAGLSREDLHQSDFGLSLDFYMESSLEKEGKNGEWRIKRIIATGANAAKNQYGDTQVESRVFAQNTGFVSQRFNPRFISLIGKTPSALFQSEKHRDDFAQNVGLETFRKLRNLTLSGTPSKVYAGRYLVFYGCKPDFCPEDFAVVIYDAITGTWRWAAVENGSPGDLGVSQPNTSSEIDDELFTEAAASMARDFCFDYALLSQTISTNNNQSSKTTGSVQTTGSEETDITNTPAELDPLEALIQRSNELIELQQKNTEVDAGALDETSDRINPSQTKKTIKLKRRVSPKDCLENLLVFQ